MLPKFWVYGVAPLALAVVSISVDAKTKQSAAHSNTQIEYAVAPKWLAETPHGTDTPAPTGAPYRLIYYDSQVQFDKQLADTYTGFRVRILSAQALAIGSLSLSWNPTSQNVTVHALRIYRDGTVINILEKAKFAVIQREANLEMSMLTGVLTATMQVPGLQVGDELEFQTTIHDRDLTFGGHVFGAVSLPFSEGPGVNRIQLGRTGGHKPDYKSSPDLATAGTTPQPEIVRWELKDPPKVVPIEGAPNRYNLRRMVEYSDFSDWREVSRSLDILFTPAAILEPTSPVKAEINKIAALSGDPIVRAGAALKLIQEQIRYVFVGLDGGNYHPISADDTWRNRFGDCKAKSVLLMAVLRGLDIDAQIIVASSTMGDGINERLPAPHVFDHVLVRAVIAGKAYYLDATKMGDYVLPLIEQPRYRYILPLTSGGSDLESLPLQAPRRPMMIRALALDATIEHASVTQSNFILGDDGALYRGQLASYSPEQADRALRSYWQSQEGWITPDEVQWRYDGSHSATILTIKGKAKLDWEGNAQSGRSFNTPRGGFYPPQEPKRPDGQDQKVPWQTDFPSYICSVTNVRLPKPGTPKLVWDYISPSIDTKIGGVHYYRKAGLSGGVFRSIRISKTYLPELTADQASAIKSAIPSFNNNMSQVYEREISAGDKRSSDHGFNLPLVEAVDWSAVETPCSIGRDLD
jgi:hypothetical protein